MPDFDPGDLQRIEVLRGPQGTLYGASSVGGLVNFVTVDPSLAGVSGRLEAGGNSVQNGSELGYTFRGSVNVPLSSDFAVRASAFTRQDPGYIDDPVLGLKGVNEDRASGGHLAALWQPSETFSLKLSALYQTITGNGTKRRYAESASVFRCGAVRGFAAILHPRSEYLRLRSEQLKPIALSAQLEDRRRRSGRRSPDITSIQWTTRSI